MAKDSWDKLEIVGKVLGAILVPGVLGWAAYGWNSQRTQLQTTAAMTQIAVGILSEQPEQSDGHPDPLRAWAVAVLQNPSDPPTLGTEEAQALLTEPLAMWTSVWEAKVAARDNPQPVSPEAEEWLERLWQQAEELRRSPENE